MLFNTGRLRTSDPKILDVWYSFCGRKNVRLGVNGNPASKSVIARYFVFESKFMCGGLARPEPAGEFDRSPRHPGSSGCHGRERFLAQLGPFAARKGGGWNTEHNNSSIPNDNLLYL